MQKKTAGVEKQKVQIKFQTNCGKRAGVLQLYNFLFPVTVLPVVHSCTVYVRVSIYIYIQMDCTSPNRCVSIKFPLNFFLYRFYLNDVFVANFLGVTYVDHFYPFILYVSFRPLMESCGKIYIYVRLWAMI